MAASAISILGDARISLAPNPCIASTPTGDQAMNTYRKVIFAMAPLCMGLVLGATSHAQTYPHKTIKIIVTAAPGGPADFPARLATQILNTKFGQPVVVEHRPGA